MNELSTYRYFIQLRKIFKDITQLSWTIGQTEKRYPAPEGLTTKELSELIKFYLALGLDLDNMAKDFKKIYKEYKDEQS